MSIMSFSKDMRPKFRIIEKIYYELHVYESVDDKEPIIGYVYLENRRKAGLIEKGEDFLNVLNIFKTSTL